MIDKLLIDYRGFNPPIFGGQQNILSRQSGERLIKNDLLQLLLTSPGERVMRPDFGTIIKESLFEPIDSVTLRDIEKDVNNKIRTFEPRVSATANVALDADNNTLRITVSGIVLERPNSLFEFETSIPLRVGDVS